MNKVIIGIVSGLPSDNGRTIRFERAKRLIKQLKELGPDLSVVLLAQNGRTSEQQIIKSIHDKVIIYQIVERLGILKARKMLRKLLLETDGNYFIFFDDDAIIETSNNAHLEVLKLIEEHPQGGAFSTRINPHGGPGVYNPFSDSQLNLACISRHILEKEDLPNVDPEQSQGFEDRVYSMTILVKYPGLRGDLPVNIYCNHFKNPDEPAPSTGSKRKKYKWKQMRENTLKIEASLIEQYHYEKTK